MFSVQNVFLFKLHCEEFLLLFPWHKDSSSHCNINALLNGRNECEEVAKRLIIGHRKRKLCFEELVCDKASSKHKEKFWMLFFLSPTCWRKGGAGTVTWRIRFNLYRNKSEVKNCFNTILRIYVRALHQAISSIWCADFWKLLLAVKSSANIQCTIYKQSPVDLWLWRDNRVHWYMR